MRIQHNIAALNSYRNLTGNNNSVSKNLEKLSSGYRINRAGDDAAGLAISEKMRAQITGLDTAQKNANDGISLVQTAEGAMTEVHSMLNRMVELADQSANGTYQDEVDRENLQKEINSLKDEIDRISDSTNFNGINLLDGSLEAQKLSKVDVAYNTETAAAGVTVNKQDGGVGSKGEYSIDLKTLNGTGDKITFNAVDKDGTALVAGGLELTYGDSTTNSTFTGSTLEEQAQSIADAIKMDAKFNQNFDVKVEGSKVTLTSKVEGLDGAKVTGINSVDQTLSLGGKTPTVADLTGEETLANGGWTGAFSADGATSGIQPEAGDILTFNFKGANNEKLTARVEITADMLTTDIKTTTENIVNKLKQTKFDDVAETAADESSFRVSDLFDITANKSTADGTTAAVGDIHVNGQKAGGFNVEGIDLERNGSKTAAIVSNATPTQVGVAATGAAAKYVIDAPATGQNFTAGDKFTLTGTLSDGKTFSVELEAGEDFKIGADYDASMDEIVKALTDANSKVQVSIGDKKVDANKVFVTGGTAGGEFKLTNAAGELTIDGVKKGAGSGVAGNITNASLSNADSADVTISLTNGIKQGSAVSSVTLDNNIEYGTAIKIGDKTYEIVEDSRDVSNRNNVAVQISDLKSKSASEIAKALTDTVNGVYGDNGDTMTATATGDTITFTSKSVGSDVAAIEVSTPYGDEVTTASFQFDPSAVKEGSTFTFNGNSYQFVKTGEKAGTGKTAIEVADFDKATSKSLGDAFAAVAKNGTVKVADDGTVTLRSAEGADGTISKPEISFYDGLSLQIGDTSDSFNQLSVSVKDMHASSLGIGDVDISTQAGAKSAIDKIKGAINSVSSVRGDLGAIQNRLEHTINNLSVTSENMTAAESRIRDVDMAQEMMNYTKNNILVQASQAMLAQANQIPQGVLQLLQ